MPRQPFPHRTCNAFCRGNAHCNLIYAEPGASDDLIAASLERVYDMTVIGIEPAREAQPLDQNPRVKEKLHPDQVDLEDDSHRLLVWWRSNDVR